MKGMNIFILLTAILIGMCAFLMFSTTGMINSFANLLKALFISIGIPTVLGCVALVVGKVLTKKKNSTNR